MTRSPSDGLKGSTRPRVESLPLFHTSAGQDAIDLAASAGLILDPWQEYVLEHSLGERRDGHWSAYEVALNVPRQNGKGSVLEARELAGLALFGEKTLIHTAHEFKTAREHYIRMKALIKNSYLVEEVKGYRGDAEAQMGGMTQGNSSMAIEFKNGSRLLFLARSKGSGRGFSGDFLALDEAYALTENMMDAIAPAMSARTNPQIWYTSSAGMPDSYVLEEIMQRGKRGDDPELAYFEYSVDPDNYDPESDEDAAMANPSAGYHKPWENIHRQRRQLTEIGFAREHLGVWEKIGGDSYIKAADWAACRDDDLIARLEADPDSYQTLTRVALAVDAPPGRSHASVCVAGAREDGSLFVELLRRDEGMDWVAPYVRALLDESDEKVPVWADGQGVIASLGVEFRQHRVRLMHPPTDVYRKACGVFYDKVVQGEVRHKGDPDLDAAVAGAVPSSSTQKLWAWTSKTTDVSPLVAATLAVYGSVKRPDGSNKTKRRGAVFA